LSFGVSNKESHGMPLIVMGNYGAFLGRLLPPGPSAGSFISWRRMILQSRELPQSR